MKQTRTESFRELKGKGAEGEIRTCKNLRKEERNDEKNKKVRKSGSGKHIAYPELPKAGFYSEGGR